MFCPNTTVVSLAYQTYINIWTHGFGFLTEKSFNICPHPLSGKSVGVGAFCNPPEILCSKGRVTGGFVFSVLKMLARKFRFHPKFGIRRLRLGRHNKTKSIISGVWWKWLLDELQLFIKYRNFSNIQILSGEFHIGIGKAIIDSYLKEFVDFGNFVYILEMCYVSRQPRHLPGYKNSWKSLANFDFLLNGFQLLLFIKCQ